MNLNEILTLLVVILAIVLVVAGCGFMIPRILHKPSTKRVAGRKRSRKRRKRK